MRVECSSNPRRDGGSAVSGLLPARISPDGRTATWNPALTRAARVRLAVRGASGGVEQRPTLNSGRARVREGEQIEGVSAEGEAAE